MIIRKIITNEYGHRYYIDDRVFSNENDELIASLPVGVRSFVEKQNESELYDLTLLVSRAYEMGRKHERKEWQNKIKSIFNMED